MKLLLVVKYSGVGSLPGIFGRNLSRYRSKAFSLFSTLISWKSVLKRTGQFAVKKLFLNALISCDFDVCMGRIARGTSLK